MNVALWIAQGLLALAFLSGGIMKAFQYEKVKATMPWAKDSSNAYVQFIGYSEIAGSLGLILPGAFGIATWLTGAAAVGLAVVMLLAAIVHVQRKEYQAIGINVVLLLISLFVAYGRFVAEPF